MKTKLRNIVMTIGLTAVLGSATLNAQQASNKSTAHIPFDFQVMKTTLPAGEYAVFYAAASKMIVFQNVATGRSSMMLAHPFFSGTKSDSRVAFRYDGERYTLEEVWFAGVNGGVGPLKGRHDRDSERGIVATVRLLNK